MSKSPQADLEVRAEQIEEWMQAENLELEAVRDRLAGLGCPVSPKALADWWNARRARRVQAELLALIASAAGQCREIERDFAAHTAPSLETLVSLHRVLIFRLTAQANATPELLRVVTDSLRPALEFAKLQEKQKSRELAEQKHRDALAAQKEARQREDPDLNPAGGLRPETLAKIERELNLL
jgi:hypothetical protein